LGLPDGGIEEKNVSDKSNLSEDRWQEILTPEQFDVLRRKGTERAFSGAYWDEGDHGTYRCAGCNEALFSSESKFDSGTGWPSFSEVVEGGRVRTEEDHTLGMRRVEVSCANCDGHLGHIFPDGPAPGGARYCINSVALVLDSDEGSSEGSGKGSGVEE
jgi:peptide-methionine (R)-S-oxide reductase